MKIIKSTYGILASTAIFCGCVKPFSPAVTTVNANILVVEGFVNTGGDTTKVKLSHTVVIGSKNSSTPETGATVTVEDAAGKSYPVPETTTKGSYASKGALALTTGTQYRLRIKTAGGKTYLSDLVVSKAAPPIDSIGYNTRLGTMQLCVNSHDNSNQTIYYKYAFSEAWEFHSKYLSSYISNGVDWAVQRTPALVNYYCYASDSSTNITLNSTASLSQDVVNQFTVNTLPDTSYKLMMRYSILVSQQALTKDGYAFWQNMAKNTQDLGSIFDAQPSNIAGNVHNINDTSEPVIGYISAGTIQKKRVYINQKDLPSNYVSGYPYGCDLQTAIYTTLHNCDKYALPYGYVCGYQYGIALPAKYDILSFITDTVPFPVANVACADCTVSGTKTPPSFWKP